MAEALVTKRLHVSGLTPAITKADIERRLSAFGTVKATDGFGACDALGDPRKFAYVTIEATPRDLAKCLNVLSGSTWKGTKLRIGEAKPDFRERIAHINALPPPPPRRKRHHTRNHGSPSSTLPLTPLSSVDAAKTPGWIVTPSGRVVRPMKMRPGRPLEPMRAPVSELKSKFAGKKDGKVKRRIKPPPVRARRRTIDPTKWDSTYLTGMFLDAIPVPYSSHTREVAATALDVIESESEEDENDNDNAHESDMEGDVPSSLERTPATCLPAASRPSGEPARREDSTSGDICQETTANLTLLSDMFGDSADWGGGESVDDIEMEDSNHVEPALDQVSAIVDDEDEIEIVPRGYSLASGGDHKQTKGKGKEIAPPPIEVENLSNGGLGPGNADHIEMVHTSDPAVPSASATAPPVPKLGDLFAPREEESSFSLLGHLGLDLELEEDILALAPPAPAASPSHQPIPQPIPTSTQHVHVPTTTKHHRSHPVTLDSSRPLLFPLPESLPYPLTPSPSATRTHARVPCILFSNPNPRPSQTINALPPSSAFTRSPDATAESIREQWERNKVALTHAWKKAWREARGGKRGRGGGGGDE